MDWLERNLDAYRLVADILTDLRGTLRRDLEAIHGDTWFRTGLPPGLLDRLIAAKEEEKSIDWYESEYQQVIDYAVFPDLLEILEHNAGHFRDLMVLAPSPALLHARFLELEVIRNKLGRTRPVSGGEVAFLKTFHARFRRAVDGRARSSSEQPEAAAADHRPVAGDGTAVGADPSPDGAGSGDGASSAAAPEPAPTEPAAAADGSQPRAAIVEEAPAPPPADEPPQPARPPSRPPQRQARTAAAASAAEAPVPVDDDEPAEADPSAASARRRPSIAEALENNDTRSVLRELYREVTSIADGIWSSNAPPSTPMWDLVSTSAWYEHNFSKLQLRPLSDFYEVISKVERRMDDGASRDELQKFLKESNFAQVLLALRDMFQKAGL